jgi:hypothetical protein
VKEDSTDTPKKLTDEIVKTATDGFQAQKAHLDQGIGELRTMLNGGSPQAAGGSEPGPPTRRRMSAAAR